MAERLNQKSEELVLKNLKLVFHIAKKYTRTYHDLDELGSVGTLGLIKAAQTFDDTKGIKFVTYAGRCICNEILMFIRREKPHLKTISLDDPISVDRDGSEFTLRDILSDSSVDFVEEIAERSATKEIFERFINIILNLLSPKERLVMLYKIAGFTQKLISQNTNFSQSYVSRLEKKIIKLVKIHLNTKEQFKEVFSMTMVNDLYKISFSSKDVINFNKIFITFSQNLISINNLPDFKIIRNKEQISILLPAERESFIFVAQIMQEIDDYCLTYASNKNILGSFNKITSNCSSTPISYAETKRNCNQPTVDRPESCYTKIINYVSTMTSFSTKQVKNQFPEMSIGAINSALQAAKRNSLIKSTSRGNYEVISNKDNTPEN